MIDRENGTVLGKGGAGGIWQNSGQSGSGFGSGGGGQGGYDGSNARSGRGAPGYARIIGLRL